MKIGSKIELPNFPVGLAPMAGVSDQAYRQIVKEFSCDWLVSEMVSAKGLQYNNERTLDLLAFDESERPLAIQLFGNEPEILAEAAKRIEAAGVDMIDLNMGCPMPKIVNNGEGSALLRNLPLASQVVSALVKAVSIPVTVKIRIGWSDKEINGVETAKAMEAAGASLIAVHGRTREQYYTGTANWGAIRDIKEAVDIPVVGNGDVTSPEKAKALFEETGCDGIQVGRAAQGNPWLFKQIHDYLKTGTYEALPSWEERRPVMERHFDLLVKYKSEMIAVREMRSHAAWYTKGLRGAAFLRQHFNQANTMEDYRRIADSYHE